MGGRWLMTLLIGGTILVVIPLAIAASIYWR